METFGFLCSIWTQNSSALWWSDDQSLLLHITWIFWFHSLATGFLYKLQNVSVTSSWHASSSVVIKLPVLRGKLSRGAKVASGWREAMPSPRVCSPKSWKLKFYVILNDEFHVSHMSFSCFAESDPPAVYSSTADVSYGEITVRTNSRHRGTAAQVWYLLQKCAHMKLVIGSTSQTVYITEDKL